MKLWRESVGEYFRALGWWALLMLGPITLDILGVVGLFTSQLGQPWFWFSFGIVSSLLLPLLAFHRLRIATQGDRALRFRELRRRFIEAKHAIARLAPMDASTDAELFRKTVETYLARMDDLRTEAELEHVRKTIEPFAVFAGFHLSRFVGALDVLGEPEQRGALAMHPYEFIARLAERSDELMEELRRLETVTMPRSRKRA